MVLLPDHDVVSFPDAWGSFQKFVCVLYIGRPCGGWGLDLGQMTHPNSVLACDRVQGIFVLILVLLFFQMQGSNLSAVACCVLEMFAFARVDGFYSYLDWTETKQIMRQRHKRAVNLIICIAIVKLLSPLHSLKPPQGNVDHLHCCSYTWVVFPHQSWWFHYHVLQKHQRSPPHPALLCFHLHIKLQWIYWVCTWLFTQAVIYYTFSCCFILIGCLCTFLCAFTHLSKPSARRRWWMVGWNASAEPYSFWFSLIYSV